MSNWIVDSASTNTAEDFIMSLAGVCDGANQHDNAGFSGADVEFGHSLAARATQGRAFTVKQAHAVLKMVAKYRRQLGGKDYINDWMKQPVFKRQPIDPNDPIVVPTFSKPAVIANRHLTSSGTSAVFSFGYDTALIAAIKAIRGEHRGRKFWAAWDGNNKKWTVPVNETSITLIMQVAEKFKFDIEQRFTDYLTQVIEKTEESRMMLTLNDGQNIIVAEDSILISVDDSAILKEFEDALCSA